MSTERTLDPVQPDQTDQTLRPDNDTTMRPTTIEPEASQNEGTARADGKEASNEDVKEESFILKGVLYRLVRVLSNNSGEAQVFLVEHDGETYVLKIYYPNFDVNKKILQAVYNFGFEMIVRVYDFGKTYVDGKHRYYELMEYLKGGTLSEFRMNGDQDKFRRIALQVLQPWPIVTRVTSSTRMSNPAISSSATRNIRNLCWATLASRLCWVRMGGLIRPLRPGRLFMLPRRCMPTSSTAWWR